MLIWQPQIFYICKLYLFFHMYDPFSIPCLAATVVFCKCPICSLTSMTTYWFLNWQTCFFFLIYSSIFWNSTYMCIYMNHYYWWSVDSLKCFTLVSYILLHIYDPFIIHVWCNFFLANAYKAFTEIHTENVQMCIHCYVRQCAVLLKFV